MIAALATGFIAIALQQNYVVDMLGLPASWKALAFPYQLCLGTAVAFATCLVGNQRKAELSRGNGAGRSRRPGPRQRRFAALDRPVVGDVDQPSGAAQAARKAALTASSRIRPR